MSLYPFYRVIRGFVRPFGTLLLVAVSAYLWINLGPGLIHVLQSGDPAEVSSLILAMGCFYFIVVFAVQMNRTLFQQPVTVSAPPTLGLARRRGEGPDAGRAAYATSAREAAVALHGPKAGKARINEAAERILDGWSGRPNLTLRESSRHEAAHAIVAHHFGAIVLSATVDGDANGQVTWAVPPEPLTAAEDSWMKLCIAIAGNVLDHSEGSHNAGSVADYAQVHGHAVALISSGQGPAQVTGPLTIENILVTARQTVRQILAPQNRAIYEIARELESKGSLTGFEVNTILADHIRS